jgi:hypothetical protein
VTTGKQVMQQFFTIHGQNENKDEAREQTRVMAMKTIPRAKILCLISKLRMLKHYEQHNSKQRPLLINEIPIREKPTKL